MKRNRLPLVVATSATLLVTILSTWVLIQNRTALGGCNAANSPTQVTVDLLVTGTSEPTEESPGKFMCLNDNDNAGGATAGVGNGVSDITESSFPADDPDLVKITLTVTPQAGGSISGESAKLHLPKDSAGATLVKVWSDAHKTTLVSTNPHRNQTSFPREFLDRQPY